MLDGIGIDQHEQSGFSHLSGNIIFWFGTLVTVAWIMGLPLLWFESWPGRMTRPNSGLCFLVAGLALRLAQEEKIDGTWKVPEFQITFTVRRTVQVLGAILVIVGTLTIIEHISSLNLHMGTLLVVQKWFREIDDGQARMTFLSALQFVLAGTAFLAFDKSFRQKFYPAEIAAAVVLSISLDSLIAFLYLSDRPSDLVMDSPVPILSSVMFLVLSVGILASRRNRGLVAVWTARYNGSIIVRKWLPGGIVVIIFTGEIVALLEDFKLLDPSVSLSIFTVVVISFIGVVVMAAAIRINGSERKILHTNRLYAVLSQANETMVRMKDRRLLLNSICDTMTIYGEFPMAWIFVAGPADGNPEISACSGNGCNRLKEDAEAVRSLLESGPMHDVLTGEEYVILNKLDTKDETLSPLMKNHMTRLGHKSMMVLRLTSLGKTAGLLAVCSEEAGFFRTEEVSLLREIAMDLSFALDGLEREKQRESAEIALRESEERFRATFEKAAVGIVLLTPTGIMMKANPHFCLLTGYSETELTGRSFLEITYWEDVDNDRISFDRMLDGEIANYSAEKRYVRKDGNPVWVHLSAALVRGSDGEPQNIISIVQDTSERKVAELLLKKSREQYQQFFEEDITADFIATVDGKILSCNPAFARIFGFDSVEEAMTSDAWELYESREHRRNFLELLQSGGKIEYHEMTMRKRDGSEIYVIRSAFGEFDAQGRLFQTKNYLFDDTRRRMLERQVLQTQKMESLGTLAGGIAHDFNNILGIIMGHTGLLKRKDLSTDRAMRSLEAIDFATRRGAGLIRQLLTFARKEDRVFENLDVNEVLRDLNKLLEETLPRLVTIRLELAERQPLITGDQNQIHQAILNLCVNARDAMLDRNDGKPPGGLLSLSTSFVKGDDVRERFPKAVKERYVKVTVADTGVGMDDNTRRHIFEPFFTTKERGKGTGLGLATVYGIVEGHDGFLDVASEPGVGTSFSIYLPAQNSESRPDTTGEPGHAETEGGMETVLVVEDEEMLTDFLREILTGKGYKVLTAPDGETAVSVYAANFKNIDIVLSDLGLPRLGGTEMLGQLLRINPDARVIFASGFMDPETKSKISDAGAKEFIQKPYSAAEVLSRVREVLNG